MTLERRNSGGRITIQTRSDGGAVLVGHASVWHRADDPGTQFELWKGAVERIDRRAFDRALRDRHDVRALRDHDPSALLGRVTAGTLRLAVDEIGLRYEIDLPDTQAGRDVRTSVERGDLSGSSFAFLPRSVRWDDEGDLEVRTILDADLYDVGPVAFPAYEATTAGLRSCSADVVEARTERDEWRNGRRRLVAAHDAVAVRMRLAALDQA